MTPASDNQGIDTAVPARAGFSGVALLEVSCDAMNSQIDRLLPIAAPRGFGFTFNVLSLLAAALLFTCAALSALGCNGRPALVPNSDVALRKDATAFAAD